MRWLLTTVCFLASLTPALAEDCLPSRTIDVPLAAVPTHGPWSFDLIDLREEMRLAHLTRHVDVDPHTFFVVKHHVGIAGGYDNGIARQRRLLPHGGGMGPLEFRGPLDRDRARALSGDRSEVAAIDHEGSGDVHGQHHLGPLPRRLHLNVGIALLPEPRAGIRSAREPDRVAVRIVLQHEISRVRLQPVGRVRL